MTTGRDDYFLFPRGFALVELLIATAILAVAILGIVAALPRAYFGITKSGQVSTITHLAYEKIDELKAVASINWNHSSLTNGTHPPTNPERMVGSDFPGYSITWEVRDNTPAAKMKTVIVEVGYYLYDQNGNSITTTNSIKAKFQTFISQ